MTAAIPAEVGIQGLCFYMPKGAGFLLSQE
jgi:hypothetical protein